MSNDPSPLKYMGTQSHETMALEAAMAERAARSAEHSADPAEDSAVGKAATWAVDRAKDTVRVSAAYVGERATGALKSYMGHEPLRAMLIAAGAGAVLMVVATKLARSGARAARRSVRSRS